MHCSCQVLIKSMMSSTRPIFSLRPLNFFNIISFLATHLDFLRILAQAFLIILMLFVRLPIVLDIYNGQQPAFPSHHILF
jgi:hypothetical protein